MRVALRQPRGRSSTGSCGCARSVDARFLAGGTGPSRLSPPAIIAVVCGGTVLLATETALRAPGSPADLMASLLSAVAATLTAILTAAAAARWLGNRVGLAAGLIYLSTRHVLLCGGNAAEGTWLAAAVTAAMFTFALANVPGPLALAGHRAIRWCFYAAVGVAVMTAGAVGPVLIFAACVMFWLCSEDGSCLRFLANPAGLAGLLVLGAIRLFWAAAWQDVGGPPMMSADPSYRWALRPEVLPSLAGAMLPWTPLTLLSVAAGVRQGHDTAAVWQFLGSWIAGPLLLATLGLLGKHPPLGALLPPLAIITAAGLVAIVRWVRWHGFTARRAFLPRRDRSLAGRPPKHRRRSSSAACQNDRIT